MVEANPTIHQRHLTKELPLTQADERGQLGRAGHVGNPARRDQYLDHAAADDVHLVGGLALADDDVASIVDNLPAQGGDLLDLLRRKPREQLTALQQLDD